MSFLNWFSGKSAPSVAAPGKNGASLVRDMQERSRPLRDKPAVSLPDRLAGEPGSRSEERKLKRHARREQLYQAVRDAFTHAGVLSASYRFKVLSLDQAGNEFMVMVDVDQSFDHRAEKLADIASKIVQTAKVQHEISVTSVYWRVATSAVPPVGKTDALKMAQPADIGAQEAAVPAQRKTANPLNPGYDPILDDEVAAFKQALVAASANGPASAGSPVSANAAGKERRNPRSYTLLTGFEDTEMPESSNAPALSATQYGDLH